MKILILGAGGFIGAHLVKKLLDKAHQVTGVDIYDDKIREFLPDKKLIFIHQDIREQWKMNSYIEASDLVIDLIAYANPGLYVKLPLEVFNLNFMENLKIAESCVKFNKRLIQFSSCEVYGKTIVSFAKEDLKDPEDPKFATFSEETSPYILGAVDKHRWIYASAKQLLERVLHAYGLERDFNYSIIRPFNFIGPKIDYLLDETDGIPRVFSYFMDALIHHTPMKLVDGGEQRRSYTYIDDAIDCIYRIVENEGEVCNQQIFNVGSPYNEVSMRQLAEVMRDIYAAKYQDVRMSILDIIEVSGEEFYGPGYDDSDRRIPDITKARTLLGWEPKWKFRELLEITMEYYMTDYMQLVKEMREKGEFKHDIINKANQFIHHTA
jgi:UDP-apiose/xylose synthase